MTNEKLEEIFKIQLINLINDLLIVFQQDPFILEIKNYALTKIKSKLLFSEIKEYFNTEIEQCILDKNDEVLFQNNYAYVPITKGDFLKLKLVKYWNSMSLSNKDKVWGYLLSLLQIYKNMK